jgi:hypothetical protein
LWPWLLVQVLLGLSEVLALAKDWEHVRVPAVLGEVRDDWVNHHQLSSHESHQHVWVDLATLGNQVVFLDRCEFEEGVLQDLLVLDLIKVLSGVGDSVIYSVLEDGVPQIEVFLVSSKVY